MKRIVTIIACLGLLLLGAGAAMAASVTASYGIGDTDAPNLEQFLFNKYIDHVTETFDVDHDNLSAGATLSSTGFMRLNVGPMIGSGGYVADGSTAKLGEFAVTGDRFFSNGVDGAEGTSGFHVAFDANREHRAVGFYISGFDTNSMYTVTFGMRDGTSYTVDLAAYVAELVDIGLPIYFGFETDGSFDGMFFHKSPDNFGLDNLSTMTTPIPGAVWLLGTGLFGLLGYRRLRG
jgi:hypothetical protein